MTITLFIFILTIGSSIASLFTEALKKVFCNSKASYSANLLALITAIVVGCGGTTIAYLFMNIPWTLNNIICLVLMTICVWIGEMVGYDKVLQLISQIKR